MVRRDFLTRASLLAVAPLTAVSAADPGIGLIDTNVTLGAWPIRRGQSTTAAELVTRLRRHGVTSAWAAHFDAVLHTDLAGANARLAAACAADGGGLLQPFGTVNPTLPDWEEDVRRCHEVHRMPGLRLFPGYHGYALDDPRFGQLLDLASRRRLVVQIALTLEDDRSQNPSLTSAPVNVAPLADLLPRLPGARVQLLNATSRVLAPGNPLQLRLTRAGVALETATLEGVEGLAALLARDPAARVAFGSHTPYFYFESALLKLQESALPAPALAAVRSGHAHALLAPS